MQLSYRLLELFVLADDPPDEDNGGLTQLKTSLKATIKYRAERDAQMDGRCR